MPFEVVNVSRGDIDLKDGGDEVRLLGEGLVPANESAPGFLVYLNSFLILGVDGWDKITDNDKQTEIIASIKSYFSERHRVVDFE
jgi:immunity protein 74 of polymorphic toxin system